MRKILENALPIKNDSFTIRHISREDLEAFYNWPDYPHHYSMFNSSIKTKSKEERDIIWDNYLATHGHITLVIDHVREKCIGKYSLIFDETSDNVISNMGIRIRPDYCNKGYGRKLLETISEWAFINQIKSIQFDVLESNERAVKCYSNASYKIIKRYEKHDAWFIDMMRLNPNLKSEN